MKITKYKCSVCEADVVRVKESYMMRMGKKIRILKVIGGYLIISSLTARLPICKECWYKATEFWDKNRDPLRKLLVSK